MGTRHLTMVVSDGKTRIAQYGQWDGYPKGQGYTVLDFLRKQKGNFEKFKKKLENCRFINDKDQKQIDKFMKSIGSKGGWMTSDQAEKYHKAYPYMNRDNGAKILDMVLKSKGEVLLSDATNFAADSLFCEWAYVIDFDKNVLECYGGFTTEPVGDDNRFKQFEADRENKEYYCITLLKTYELDKLPNKRQFVNDLEPKEVEEEV
jgi:hypothetical protein